MKKQLISSVAAAAIILGGAYGINEIRSGTAEAAPAVQQTQSKTLIGVAKAEEIALKAAPGQVESIDLEKKLSGTYYDIDIQQKNQEIDVRVDAYSGKVLSVRKETDNDDDDDHYNSTASGAVLITAAKAAEAATAKVAGKVTDVDLDRDDGTAVYEVEIRNGRTSTEVGIDAYTGKVLYTDVDSDDDDDDNDGYDD
ncbi:PepSY domain-containing protein [Paenibacillus typhae]|uniref:PepSY domain-containing protein n=1 Tax=Paenibacillus typhae TaxID=1174501 RepID=UPI001C8EBFCB|nr:PepSY domain-containing protein [Paenibacillus typhae]MBY0014661.1 PepSY domain-containing protein [Paenibacillus typhae]